MTSREPLLECVVNVSEGRRRDVIDEIADAGGSVATVLDVHSDPDHNRCVLTLAGHPATLVHGVILLAGHAATTIDLRQHDGAHPRLGVVDVVPFVPLGSAPMHLAVAAAKGCARRLWEELGIPSFLYESAASSPMRRALPDVRAGAFKTLVPDVGGPAHASAGAAVVGARPVLVAYNITLQTSDVAVARRIARAVRERDGGLPHLRALGMELPTAGVAQVSMNLTSPHQTTMADAFDAVRGAAAAEGTSILAGELVGLAPRVALGGRHHGDLGLAEPPPILEDVILDAFGYPPP
jgi:glutamate formiminotransferase